MGSRKSSEKLTLKTLSLNWINRLMELAVLKNPNYYPKIKDEPNSTPDFHTLRTSRTFKSTIWNEYKRYWLINYYEMKEAVPRYCSSWCLKTKMSMVRIVHRLSGPDVFYLDRHSTVYWRRYWHRLIILVHVVLIFILFRFLKRTKPSCC